MSFKYLLGLCTSICLFYACQKKVEDIPECADTQVSLRSISPIWNFNSSEYSIYPAVFDNLVVFSRLVSPGKKELLGFESNSGKLLWQHNVSSYFFGGDYKQAGANLYFTDTSFTKLLAFDVLTQQIKTVWTAPDSTKMTAQFALKYGFAICPVVNDAETSAYLVNLTDGNSRKIGGYATKFGNVFAPGIRSPQVTITPQGDTIFCFVKLEFDPAYSVISLFSSWNITTKEIHETDIVSESYYQYPEGLLVDGQYAWFQIGNKLQCLDVRTSIAIHTFTDNNYTGKLFSLKGDKAFAGGNPVVALDAASGTILWSRLFQSYDTVKSFSFEKNGRLFLMIDDKLVSLDMETGCLTGEHKFPAAYSQNSFNYMVVSLDKKMMYMSGYSKTYVGLVPE